MPSVANQKSLSDICHQINYPLLFWSWRNKLRPKISNRLQRNPMNPIQQLRTEVGFPLEAGALNPTVTLSGRNSNSLTNSFLHTSTTVHITKQQNKLLPTPLLLNDTTPCWPEPNNHHKQNTSKISHRGNTPETTHKPMHLDIQR